MRSIILNKDFIVNSCIKCGFVIDRDGNYGAYSNGLVTESILIKHQGLNIEQIYTTDTAINVECVYQINNNLKIKYDEGFDFGKWVIKEIQ